MSISFEIFPTTEKIPKCEEITEYSINLFNGFIQNENIVYDIKCKVTEVSFDSKKCEKPVFLTSNEEKYTIFNINEEGKIYVFYDKIEKIDEEFWNEEIKINENARFMEKKIWDNLKTGYSWKVKRTMGQPAVVNLYYGYLAIAIAVLTEGILYSDDGAWDYECFPIEGKAFEKEYLNLDKLNNITLKHSIESCLFSLKN